MRAALPAQAAGQDLHRGHHARLLREQPAPLRSTASQQRQWQWQWQWQCVQQRGAGCAERGAGREDDLQSVEVL